MPTTTETTADLFCRLAGITREVGELPKLCMPKCEVYYPSRLSTTPVRYMAFKWNTGAMIEFTSYSNQEFWGGLPVQTN